MACRSVVMHNVEVTGLAAASLPQGPCGLTGDDPGHQRRNDIYDV